jgi:hypothetical protein
VQSIPKLLVAFRKGTEHLRAMAQKLECPWKPDESDPRMLHNNYARNLVTCYVSKFSDLSDGLLVALKRKNYLVYALTGRAMIENVAALRYYVQYQYKPIFEKGSLSADDFRKLIEIDDKHLRGSRFDWESFLFLRYSKLKDDAVQHLKDKKDKRKIIVDSVVQEQVNVLTFIDKWASETPEVLIAYNLFCDLVHPSIGSSFLVASVSKGNLYFSSFKGERVGKNIFEQSFPILLSVTHKPFGEQLMLLMGTIWHDDEIRETI